MILVSMPTLIKPSPTEDVKTLSNNPYPQTHILSSSPTLLLEEIKMAASALLQTAAPPKTKTYALRRQTPKLLQLKQSVHLQRFHALKETQEEATRPIAADEVTKKYGLEVGLWKIFSSKEAKEGSKVDQAKELLAKYGGAYLATSITLSLVSFTFCYLLVSAGIDIQALLAKVGIVTDETGGKVGTFALAYAAHKAASPIRFPPTVALTPIVASWIGKKTSNTDK